MEGNRLVGSEIHGFRTMEDLDVVGMMEEAKSRWLRPNEIHAILCNHNYFTVNVKPKNLPQSGTIVLFDRKMLRNFRKDGHNWKKKKDGKTVKEAHEHLKVGNIERIHVYYAHGEDSPTFVRRCYWLLDKSLEHIVLVHYRETQEGSPATPGNSNSSSGVSDPCAPWHFTEESDSAVDRMYYPEQQDNMIIKEHEKTLHEINTLDWEELLVPDDSTKVITPQQGQDSTLAPMEQYLTNSSKIVTAAHEAMINAQPLISGNGVLSVGDSLNNVGKDNLQTQDSFGRWMNNIIADSPGSLDEALDSSSISTGQQPFASPSMDNHLSSAVDQIFNITDISPSWALSSEPTKVLVVGFFNGGQLPHPDSPLHLACGDSIYPIQAVQAGVFRSVISTQTPGLVNLYLTYDGQQPISQVFTFEVRAPVAPNKTPPLDDRSDWDEFRLQMRLAQLLFSSSKKNILHIFSNKVSQITLKEAETFTQKTAHISNYWGSLSKMIDDPRMQVTLAKDKLFELALKNRLQEWLLEKILAGSKISERDERGQGVIHLCAILGYTWAILPFSCSNLSMDYRDKFGWTALHWAAYYGREKMVAALLSAGAKPYLVTDPTSENPSGCTPADLASKRGFDGLAAYLAEKALVAQFADMTVAGNVSGGSLQTMASNETENPNLSKEELFLKDALAAYRTAAGAAARIQEALREHSLKIRTKAVQEANPEMEARNIVAAMKIQHAFRNYETKKKMGAATRIQCRFRTWKIRQEFLNLRRQAIKIQAVYRGFRTRKQYQKVVWSVGVLEKAILRWRLKRKGFRGLQVESDETLADPKQEKNVEEDFFRASRKQAEERVERSVISVQAMFRSKRAQEDYRRMKLEHNKAKLEYEELLHPDSEMG